MNNRPIRIEMDEKTKLMQAGKNGEWGIIIICSQFIIGPVIGGYCFDLQFKFNVCEKTNKLC